MGKKNRSKNKRLKNLQLNKTTQSSPEPANPFVLKSFQSFKEDFIIKIKQITSKLLGEFEEFSAIRLQSKANIQLRFKRTGIFSFNSEFTFKDDPSKEIFEIFLKIFSKFLDALVEDLKDIGREQPEKCFISMQDAFQVIETFTFDLTSAVSGLFGMNEFVFKSLCSNLFREKVKRDSMLEKVLEKVDGRVVESVSGVLKSVKQEVEEKDTKESDMDLIVENFQRTLDLHVQSGLRNRPYFTDSWIEKVKALLRNARSNLGYC